MAAPVAIRALIGGDVDVSTVGGSGIPPIIRGAALDFLFTSFIRPVHWFYSKTSISDVGDLKGKRVAIDGLGGVIDLLLKELLKKHNLEAGRDVTVLADGVQSIRFAALSGGSIDATILTFPWNFLAAEKGFRELVNFTKQDIVQLPDALSSGTCCCNRILSWWKNLRAPLKRVYSTRWRIVPVASQF